MRQKRIIKVLVVVSILNLISMGVKFVVGYSINSSAVVADAFHSMTDLLANFIGIIALRLSFVPADDNHGFGHEKIENVASLVISFILLFTSTKVFIGAIISFFNPIKLNLSLESIFIISSTLIINVIIVAYEKYSAKILKSDFLDADSNHTLSDIYITLGVIVSLITIYFGMPSYIDSIISIVISIVIFKIGIEIFLSSTKVLIDTSIIDNQKIMEIIAKYPEVKHVHYLKNRGNQVNVYLECHMLFACNMSVLDAHKVVDCIEESIKSQFDYNFIFSIHIEPYLEKFVVESNE